jgi:hypothetical protein
LPKVEYEQRKVAHGLLKSHTNGRVALWIYANSIIMCYVVLKWKNLVQKS